MALGACGGSGETPDVAEPEATTEPIPVAMPGSGVVVQPARANWNTGYFSEAVYSTDLEALGYEVLDHMEMENAHFYEAVARGDVTFWANGWFPLHLEYESTFEQGASIAGAISAFGALQGFLVDKAGADQYNNHFFSGLRSRRG